MARGVRNGGLGSRAVAGWHRLPAAAPLVASAAAFGLCVALTVRNGFNPTDEGLIVGYGLRVLDGEVPHRDFIFSRPVGSSLLHLIDFAVPAPLFLTGRIVSALQLYVYTLLLACLVANRRVRDASPFLLGAVALAALVNLHSFPLMAWYTIDGLFLLALGAHLVKTSPRLWVRGAGLVLLGYAPLTKQSFFLAPLIGLWLLWRHHRADLRGVGGVARSLGLLGLSGALYLLVMAATGALDPLYRQLSSVTPTFGGPLIDAARGDPALGWLLLAAALLVAAWVLAWRALDDGRAGVPARRGLLVASAVADALVLLALAAVVLVDQFSLSAPWGNRLLSLALVGTVALTIVRRRFPEGAVLTLLAAWMAALSLGYPSPNLVAGSLLLATVVPLVQATAEAWKASPDDLPGLADTATRVRGRERPMAASRRSLAAAGAIVAVVILLGIPLMGIRNQHLYRDRPAEELTADLGDVAPAFGGLRTNPTTAAYLRAARECAAAAGTDAVVVAPDNTALYPAFGLRSPVPSSGLYPQEIAGSEQRVIDAFARLHATPGRHVVLWQGVQVEHLAALDELPPAGAGTAPFVHASPALQAAFASLAGIRSECGPFIVVSSG